MSPWRFIDSLSLRWKFISDQERPVSSNSSNEADSILAMSRHDFVWQSWSAWGIKCADSTSQGLCGSFSSQSLGQALQLRSRLKQLNPNMILLAEIRYHDAISTYLPDSSPWWLRDSTGHRIAKKSGTSTSNYFLLDFSKSDFQDRVAALCSQVIATGVVDGCMLDWWNSETPAHVSLAKKVRAAIGDSAILIANVNGSLPQQSASYLNGIYMEGFGQPFLTTGKPQNRTCSGPKITYMLRQSLPLMLGEISRLMI